MVFSFELIRHPNIRYRQSLGRLACCELQCMLEALGVFCEVETESLGNATFLTFSCRELTESELRYLSGHSALSLLAERPERTLLRPLPAAFRGTLDEDLAEVLKYKGKTGVTFTKMMLNMARALLTDHPPDSGLPLLVADPLCGKGTTLYCAVEYGDHALGLDTDRKAIHEAQTYFKKYLEFHRLKHTAARRSETFGKVSVPVWECVFTPASGRQNPSSSRKLLLAAGDTTLLPVLTRRRAADLLAGDLPYGVQHAPQSGSRPESFREMIARALPAWYEALRPGGVLALSFNTLTLKRSVLADALRESGFSVTDRAPFCSLEHEVEQAVVRDVIFALKSKEVSSL